MVARSFFSFFIWLLCDLLTFPLGSAGQVVRGERIPLPISLLENGGFEKGKIAVKLSESYAAIYNPLQGNADSLLTSGSLGIVFAKIDVQSVKPLFITAFQNAVANENGTALRRMKEWGFNRWFLLEVNESLALPDLISSLIARPEVELAEPIASIRPSWVPNDPRYTEQWSLNNTGQGGGTAGVDIGMKTAWDIEKGKPGVLVAVHDGGIQIDHPDLQQNMWFNKGYNFVTNSPTLVADQHGTHVAGIVGAVSNNGIGISGIAGGDGNPGTGARLMSLQIIGGGNNAGQEAVSFVYAANNGASISQNSWSYNTPDFFPSYTADAIDYFIANGGDGQIKGGLVVFSAGNSNSEDQYYPAPYSRVMAVAGTGPTDVKGAYSSYGTWVDISAPGGDNRVGGAGGTILSTILNSNFGYLQGTSMSAPHVSGVAALMASHAPGRMLADDVRSILLRTARDIYPLNDAFYAGKLGTGRLQADRALLLTDSLLNAPDIPAPANVAVKADCDGVQLTWQPNASYPTVMVATSETPGIGLPWGRTYTAGDKVLGGGVIVSNGASNTLTLPLPIDGKQLFIRLWSVDGSGKFYSRGVDAVVDGLTSVTNATATSFTNEIHLKWQRPCPLNEVLIAFSQDGTFGTPAGNPTNVGQMAGGGTRLANGLLDEYLHTGLEADKAYYYAIYPYRFTGSAWEYGKPVRIAASTSCALSSSNNIEESFAAFEFPPPQWRVLDGGPGATSFPDNKTWQRVTLAGSSPGDNASAMVNAYTQNGGGSVETLRTPAFVFPNDADSVTVSFDYAYRVYSASVTLTDSLQLSISTDCGSTFESIWKAGGQGLATVQGFQSTEFIPDGPAAWRKMNFNISGKVARNVPINVLFRATNNFGQNIWLDNIQITVFKGNTVDIGVSPAGSLMYTCSDQATVAVRISNKGKELVDEVELRRKLNQSADQLSVISSLNLLPGKDTVLRFDISPLVVGENTLRFRCSLTGGINDFDDSNDTLAMVLRRTGNINDSLKTGFDNTPAPEPGFVSVPILGTLNWTKTSVAALSQPFAMMVDNSGIARKGMVADLVTPLVTLSPTADSVFLSFDFASAGRLEDNQQKSDTLEVWLSQDCGISTTLLYRKWGEEMFGGNGNVTSPFVPVTANWRNVKIDLTSNYRQFGNKMQVIIRSRSGGANRLYVDNLNLYAVFIPQWLREQGVGVYPNPFGHSFFVWHLEAPVALQEVKVMTMAGQILYRRYWAQGTAPSLIQINIPSLAKGMYLVHLRYADKKITRRIIKR